MSNEFEQDLTLLNKEEVLKRLAIAREELDTKTVALIVGAKENAVASAQALVDALKGDSPGRVTEALVQAAIAVTELQVLPNLEGRVRLFDESNALIAICGEDACGNVTVEPFIANTIKDLILDSDSAVGLEQMKLPTKCCGAKACESHAAIPKNKIKPPSAPIPKDFNIQPKRMPINAGYSTGDHDNDGDPG